MKTIYECSIVLIRNVQLWSDPFLSVSIFHLFDTSDLWVTQKVCRFMCFVICERLFHLCCLFPLWFLHKTESAFKKNKKIRADKVVLCPCASSCSGWEEACCHGKPHLTSCLVWSCLMWVGGYISSSTWEQASSDWHQVITTIIWNKSKSQLWIKHSSSWTGHINPTGIPKNSTIFQMCLGNTCRANEKPANNICNAVV